MDSIWIALIAIAIHRLWLHEDIFAPLRRWIAQRLTWLPALVKALTCSPCFAFWSGVLALLLWAFRHAYGLRYVAAALALYPITRAVAWATSAASLMTLPRADASALTATPPSPAVAAPVSAAVAAHKLALDQRRAAQAAAFRAALPSGSSPACAPCEAAAAAAKAVADTDTPATAEMPPVSDERPVVLLTSFGDFDPAYSLVTVVLEQARALVLAGFEVQLWVNQGANLKTYPTTMPIRVTVRPIVPTAHLAEDIVDEEGARRIQAALEAELRRVRPIAVIEHDLLFVSWFVTYAAAIHRMAPIDGMRWLHVAHSAPSLPRRVTNENRLRVSLPDGHEAVCVNFDDRLRLAEYYDVCVDRVVVLPNTRDLAWWARMDPVGARIVRDLALGDPDLVQVYPLSGTRMTSKGMETVIHVFAALKMEFGHSVRLVVANAHSNDTTVAIEVERFLRLAKEVGLTTSDEDGTPAEVVFTSQRYPELAVGLPGNVVSELLLASNLFVFPSVSEAGPLVLMEAALAGCLLVLNRDVPAMADIIPHDQALWFAFGNARGADAKAHPVDVASAIDAEFRQSTSLRAKRTVLHQRSLRALADAFTMEFRRSESGPGA